VPLHSACLSPVGPAGGNGRRPADGPLSPHAPSGVTPEMSRPIWEMTAWVPLSYPVEPALDEL